MIKGALGGHERVLCELHEIAGAPLLEQALEKVDRLLDAANVTPYLAVRHEARMGEGLVNQRARRCEVRGGAARRLRRREQELACQRLVLVGVVDQELDEVALRPPLKVSAGVVERRRGGAVLGKPAKRDRDAVLAEGAFQPDRT